MYDCYLITRNYIRDQFQLPNGLLAVRAKDRMKLSKNLIELYLWVSSNVTKQTNLTAWNISVLAAQFRLHSVGLCCPVHKKRKSVKIKVSGSKTLICLH
jgi:hypothetical protein